MIVRRDPRRTDPDADAVRSALERRLGPDAAALLEDARAVLRANDTGRFVKPSLGQYPHQWNWDAAFVAIGLRHVDLERAREEVRSLLRGQWRNGMVPHVLYPEGASDYFPGPGFWRCEQGPGEPAFPTSGLTQPPVLATAVRLLHDQASDRPAARAFLAETYPRLLAWHRWLHDARDPAGTGLVAIVHPWESGTDNAPRFRDAMEALQDLRPPPYRRADGTHVLLDERPLPADYDRFMHLIGLYRDWRWEPAELYERAPFLVQDVLFNAIVYRAEGDLLALADELGEPTAGIEAWRAAARDAFEARLWDDDAGCYFDLDLRSGAHLREPSFVTFAPLFAGLPSPERARRLVEEHLADPDRFAPGEGAAGVDTRYLLPTTAKSSPRFEPRRYWCGPVWINANWMIVRGLQRYGFDEEASRLAAHTVELVRRSGFSEYYDPRDGSACGARGFSWSAALAIDLIRAG